MDESTEREIIASGVYLNRICKWSVFYKKETTQKWQLAPDNKTGAIFTVERNPR
jgi:hypothetical protein